MDCGPGKAIWPGVCACLYVILCQNNVFVRNDILLDIWNTDSTYPYISVLFKVVRGYGMEKCPFSTTDAVGVNWLTWKQA